MGEEVQHTALVGTPTNAQCSGDRITAFVNRTDAARRTLSVRLAENIELLRDTFDEGLIDRFEDTVQVLIV